MLKYRTEKIINSFSFDHLVKTTYDRPYCFQQQDGCKPRGRERISVPMEEYDYENDSIPEKVNGDEMGVSFKAWLQRDSTYNPFENNFTNELFWERNFYPDLSMVINDLYKKGLIEEGEYTLDIDW